MASRRTDRTGANTASTAKPSVGATVGVGSDLFSSLPRQTAPPGPTGPTFSAGGTQSEAAAIVTYQQVRDMMDDRDKHVDARFSSVETRIQERLDKLPNTWTIAYVVGGIAATTLTIVLAVASFGASRFDAGMNLTNTTVMYTVEAKKALEETTKRSEELKEMMKQTNLLLEVMRRQQDAPIQGKPK